jgi:membrane fusion protein (multidrug efflux system)
MMRRCALTGVIVLGAGCGKGSEPHPSAPPPQSPEVGVVEIRPQRATLTTELPGRTSAFRVAQVRARVDGIVQRRLYEEGSDVKEGQPLFQIDPAPYQAAVQRAAAQVASAEASAASAKLLAERYGRLIEKQAVSRQDYDNAIAQQKTAVASIDAARAELKTAQINLGYTRVLSPISGRSGRTLVTEGAYVQQGQATLLTTVTQLDPIYVDTQLPSIDLLRARRAMESGEVQGVEGQPKVTVVLEDGREYDLPGKLLVTDVEVDQSTGSVPIRALVPNPRGVLLPGMYLRARLQEGTDPNALLVPQRAVSRDRTGDPIAMIVKGGVVEQRRLTVDRALGDAWLVTAGIAPGDHVIVDGLQRVKPGARVTEVPAPASIAPPQPPQARRGGR